MIRDDELSEKYNEIRKKVKNSIKKEFDSEPLYNQKYLKAKIKSYNGKINTNFYNNKIPKEGSQFTCLAAILINSVFGKGKNYYPRVFSECKFVAKEKKSILMMIEKFLLILMEKILIKKILMKRILMKQNLMKKNK